MYPGEFVSLLWKHKAPNYWSLGVDCNRFGKQRREDVGLGPSGTMWFATLKEKSELNVIPQNCIPYTSIKDAKFNEDTRKFVGDQVWGWRPLLHGLVKEGYLWPSDELSYLIGIDSFEQAPRESWH